MDEKEAKRLLGFANGNPTIVSDIGNEMAKMGTDAPVIGGKNPLNLVYFSHAIVEINEARYKTLQHYFKGKDAFHLIKWDGRYFVVGEEAYSVNPGFEPLTGRAKYVKDYYGVLFISGLLRLYNGDIPPAVNAFLAHPPADLDHTIALMKSVKGSWQFESNGRRYKTVVEYVNVFDEIIGGVMNATLGVDGAPINDIQILGNGPALVFDLGGGSLDLARLNRDGSVDYNKKMDSVRIGVGRAIAQAKELFDSRFSDDLTDAEDGIGRQQVVEFFLDPKHEMRAFGEIFDCSDIYEHAAAPIVRQAKDAVSKFAGGLASYNLILLTGGGAGLYYDEICEQIFPRHLRNRVVYQTDSRRDMFKANARGGLKMLVGLKQESRRLAKRAGVKL